MPTDSPAATSSLLMIAWNKYKESEDFENTKKWALHSEHVEGSLWAAFMNGYNSRQEPVPQETQSNPPLQDAYDYLVRIVKAYLEIIPAQQGSNSQVTQREVLANAVDLFNKSLEEAPKVSNYEGVTDQNSPQKELAIVMEREVPKLEGDVEKLLEELQTVSDTSFSWGKAIIKDAVDTIEALSVKLANTENNWLFFQKKYIQLCNEHGELKEVLATFTDHTDLVQVNADLRTRLTKAEAKEEELEGYLRFHKIDPEHPTIHTSQIRESTKGHGESDR